MGWPGPLTHLQYLTWQAWLVEELWVPDRHDLYTMQLTREVFLTPGRIFGGKQSDVKLTDFMLRPRDEQPEGSAQATGGHNGRGNGDAASSQEAAGEPDQRSVLPGLPPVVTEANKDVLASKIARAHRQYQRQLEQQGLLNNPRKPPKDQPEI